MITNIGKNLEFYCGNHAKPIPLKIMNGETAFYACPKYMLKDKRHPDGHKKDEKACPNRLNFDDAGNIIMELSKMISASIEDDEFTDFTHTRFKYKYYDVEVLFYSDDRICLSVINRRVVK